VNEKVAYMEQSQVQLLAGFEVFTAYKTNVHINH
jgi:hypothetical protein